MTTVDVRVIAAGAKFIGDDIGGAAVVIRDALSGQVLAQGKTQGDSGPPGVMCTSKLRGAPVPMDADTAVFTAVLDITAATKIEVTAFGPLGALGSANTVSATTWVCPGQNLVFPTNGLLLEMPGLICQVVNPPPNTKQTVQSGAPALTVYVAMMCGCPISTKAVGQPGACPCDPQPWPPGDYTVNAVVTGKASGTSTIQLQWDCTNAGYFVPAPDTAALAVDSYQLCVYAQQTSTGNTGVDHSTFSVVSSPS